MTDSRTFMKPDRTGRGFSRQLFFDRYGQACSLQDSSLATERAVWLGVDFDVDGRESARMHLTQDMAKEIVENLQRFIETGSIEKDESAKTFAAKPSEQNGAIRDVTAERLRQVEAEGWTTEHDDKHGNGEIAAAAGVYALVASRRFKGVAKAFWPWDFQWWKPSDERRNLVKAGALILAEIERLDRTTEAQANVR